MLGRTSVQLYYDPPGYPTCRDHKEHRDGRGILPSSRMESIPLPCRLSQDNLLCLELMGFASNYLSQAGGTDTLPHNQMDNISVTTNRALNSMSIGDEAQNINVFTHIFNYVREFVAAADWQNVSFIQAVSGVDHKEISQAFNRTIERHGTTHILIKNISSAVFEQYREDIWNLADAERGSVELSFEGNMK